MKRRFFTVKFFFIIIIAKEQRILNNIQLFYYALLDQNVINTPAAVPDMHKLLKRSLLDIFIPYNNMEIAQTANSNNRNIDTNFTCARNAKIRLSHRQNKLATCYKALNSAQKTLARQELFQEFHIFLLEQSLSFKDRVSQLLLDIKISKAFKLAFTLLQTTN